MARRKISEFRAKTILYNALNLPYTGLMLDTTADWQLQLKSLASGKRYVVKVDEGIKGRFKKGLVVLDQTPAQLPAAVTAMAKQGFRYFLVEEYQKHPANAEFYLSIERQRAGNVVTFSAKGGVNVEEHSGELKHETYRPAGAKAVEQALGLPTKTLAALNAAFDANYFSFLEINPLVVTAGAPLLLDAAVEVDGEAGVFVHERWTAADLRGAQAKTPEEIAVEKLAEESQASFRLEVLNPDGQVFLLLSGGGASVVVADEVHNQGYGQTLGNYGEYSGNPNAEEAYLYTRQVLSLMLGSSAHHKVLIISGGVANFTDIRVTFQGVIRALEEAKTKLAQQNVKVFVRRGGPYEEEGLAMMSAFLKRENLLGQVAGPDLPLTAIVLPALTTLGVKE